MESSGDVKYHLGTNYTRTYKDGKSMTVEILANPSHLEVVNPVVMGKVRAE
jgi:2-oxoglutarate dehydrogenase E1 component